MRALSLVSDKELISLISTAPELHDYGAIVVGRHGCQARRGAHGDFFRRITAAPACPNVHRACLRTYIPREFDGKSVPPGPVGGTDGCKFKGPWFTGDGAGPFSTLKDLEDWYSHKIDVCLQLNQLPWYMHRLQGSLLGLRFRFQTAVLTHQDIAPRNLILDAQGKVWIIDWSLAGVYPPDWSRPSAEMRREIQSSPRWCRPGFQACRSTLWASIDWSDTGLSVAAIL